MVSHKKRPQGPPASSSEVVVAMGEEDRLIWDEIKYGDEAVHGTVVGSGADIRRIQLQGRLDAIAEEAAGREIPVSGPSRLVEVSRFSVVRR